MRIDGTALEFKDDTAIVFRSDTWLDLRKRAEKTIRVLKSWFTLNKFTLNVAKTKYLSFTLKINGLPHLGALRVDRDTLIPEAKSVEYPRN